MQLPQFFLLGNKTPCVVKEFFYDAMLQQRAKKGMLIGIGLPKNMFM